MGTQSELMEELAWLRRVIFGLVGNEAAAADLTQEVALEVLRRPPTENGGPLYGARLRGWLWTVARRKAGRERQRAAARTHAEESASRSESQDGLDRSRLQLLLHQELLTEIYCLDPADADLIIQRYLDQKAPRMIAQEMDLPVTTVRKRLSRAMDRLRVKLAESKRGADGWSAGLCLILGVPKGPAPIIHGPEKAALRTSGATGAWKVAALGLAGLGLGAAWLAFGRAGSEPEPLERAPLELALEVPEPPVDQLAPATGAAGDRRVALEIEAAKQAAEPLAAIEAAGRSSLRFVDEAGSPIGEARAIWGDEASTPHVLTVGQGGVALLPKNARGWIYAGADGFENRDQRIEWSDEGEMRVELQRQRIIPGRLTVDDAAPGREVTLWKEHIWRNHWPSQVHRDERMKTALIHHGLEWSREAITTDRDGRFVFVTRATWDWYSLCMPGDLRIVDVEGSGDVSINDRSEYAAPIHIDRDCESVTIYAQSIDPIRARFIDGRTRAPMQGLVEARYYDRDGESLGGLTSPLDGNGQLKMPAQFKNYQNGEDWLICHSLEFRLEGLVFRRTLVQPGVPEHLGTFEVPTAPLVQFRTVARSGAEFQPLRGLVASKAGIAEADTDGIVRIRAEVGSIVQALAPGHAFREVVVTPNALGGEAQLVELEPASRLSVRFDLGDMTGFDPDKSVEVSLMLRGDPIPSLRPIPGGEVHYTNNLFGRMHGGQFEGGSAHKGDYDDAISFRGLPGHALWIDGLLPAARFDVVIHDMLGGILAQQNVVMPPPGDAAPVSVSFGDLYEKEAASLVVDCRWPNSGQPYEGWVYIVRSDTGRVEGRGSFNGGRMEAGPLAPGRYRIAARAGGTPRTGDGVEFLLNAGANAFQLEAAGTEPNPR